MQIQVHTDNNIKGRETLVSHVTGVVEHALGRFGERLTRVEVHLSDENGPKTGQDDIRCTLEAHLTGRQPAAVTHHATNLEQAVDGAAQKMKRLLDGAVEQMHGHR